MKGCFTEEMVKALDPKLQDGQCLEIAQVTQGVLASDLNQLLVYISQGSNLQSALKLSWCLTNLDSNPIDAIQVNPKSVREIDQVKGGANLFLQ